MGAPERPLCRVLKSRIRRVPIRAIRSSIWVGIRDISLYPVDRRLQSPQNQGFFASNCPQAVRFFGRLKFSACGGRWRRRSCSISPGWNREGMAGRRQYTAFAPFDEVKQPPTIHPKAGQRRETTCTAGSRKCSVRTRILLHRQGQVSSRSHSCSTDGPAFLLCGTGINS